MKKEFEQLKKSFEDAVKSVVDREKLEAVKNEFLGRKGQMANLMKDMAKLADEERKVIGQLANEVKAAIEAGFAKKEQEIDKAEAGRCAEAEWIDITEPGTWPARGHLHPVSQAISEITDIFARIGFSRVSAPEIDRDFYVFEGLNMPKGHPARDDWETFFVGGESGEIKGRGKEKDRVVLTPHTSNSQVRELEKGKMPIRIININRCYRRQSDVSHAPMFHQFEGFMVDEGLTITDLKGVLDYFAKQFFGPDRTTRLRPHHFRFTEPSFEVDISCEVCSGKNNATCRLCKAGWLELGGAGMTHPNVLKAGGVDPEKYTAFAFGWGVERTLMMLPGAKIDDIRTLYRGDLRFVNQF